MNANMQEKALDVLRLHTYQSGKARVMVSAALVDRYGRKAVERKLQELTRRGYLDAAGLTAKGRAALAAHGRAV